MSDIKKWSYRVGFDASEAENRHAIFAEIDDLRARVAELESELTSHVEAAELVQRLTRELDVLINGAEAARQASLCDIVSQLKAKLAALEGQQGEPVAWMHDKAGRVDVVHKDVRNLWLRAGKPSGFYKEKVPCPVEHYTIPLYLAAGAREAQLNWSTLVSWWESGAEDWEELKGIVRAMLAQPAREAQPELEVKREAAEPVTFEQAWQTYKAKGYKYGRDALEQVKFGWEIAQEFASPPKREDAEPVAWREFDGEGSYLFMEFEGNESHQTEWKRRNPNHKGWVEPLYLNPPKRHPMTDDEITKLHHIEEFGFFCDEEEFLQIVRATEEHHNIGAAQT